MQFLPEELMGRTPVHEATPAFRPHGLRSEVQETSKHTQHFLEPGFFYQRAFATLNPKTRSTRSPNLFEALNAQYPGSPELWPLTLQAGLHN